MSDTFDKDFIKKLDKLKILTQTINSQGGFGNRKSRNKGTSLEFSDFRDYIPGDDFRRIDWNAYARFEKFIFKLFMEEKECPINIFLDTSKSMDFGEPNKGIYSKQLALGISYISFSNYDRVILTCLNDKTNLNDTVSLRGKNSISKIIGKLESINFKGEVNFINTLKGFNFSSSNGVSVIISDLFLNEDFEELIKYLKFKKQEIYVFQILSLDEITPVLDKNLRLVDCESNDYIDITKSEYYLELYKKEFLNFTNRIEGICKTFGAKYSVLNTNIPVLKVLHSAFGNYGGSHEFI